MIGLPLRDALQAYYSEINTQSLREYPRPIAQYCEYVERPLGDAQQGDWILAGRHGQIAHVSVTGQVSLRFSPRY